MWWLKMDREKAFRQAIFGTAVAAIAIGVVATILVAGLFTGVVVLVSYLFGYVLQGAIVTAAVGAFKVALIPAGILCFWGVYSGWKILRGTRSPLS